MAVLRVYQYGEEVLRKVSKDVKKEEIRSKEIQDLVYSMLETMYEHKGVGLAAPQVGVSKRIIVIDVNWPEGKQNPVVLINPKISKKEGKIESEEGCLSFKGNTYEKLGVQLSKVERAKVIKISFFDQNRKRQELRSEDNLFCRCVQHEIDHLDGVLFIDKNLDQKETKVELAKNGFKE